LKREDLLTVLETVLRINGAAMKSNREFYQIVLAAGARQLPLEIQARSGDLPASDSKVLQIVPMRFVAAADMVRLSSPTFLKVDTAIMPGNILLITENSANLKKLLDS
jgi:general secretion pathway protein D